MEAIEINKIKPVEMIPGYLAHFVHTEKMTFNFLDVKAGAAVPEHAHEHEQVSAVTKGEFELTIEGKPIRITEGMVVVIPPNTRHSGLAITDCQLLDVFAPVREDYRALSEKYK
jgi:quercetin dioxygenase-like cupin family protein